MARENHVEPPQPALLPELLRPHRGFFASFVFVITALTIAFAARMALNVVMGPTAPYLPFFVAVAVVSAYAGFLPGFTTSAAGTIMVFLFFHIPVAGTDFGTAAHKIGWTLLFLLACLPMPLLGQAYHNLARRARLTQMALHEQLKAVDMEGESKRLKISRYTALLQSELFGVGMGTGAGEVLECNDALLRMTGYTRKDLEQGRLSWRAMTPPEYAEGDERAGNEIRERGVSSPVHKELIRKDGTRIPVLLHIAGMPDFPGQYIAQVIDLSAVRRAERSLSQSEARFRIMVESIRDHAFIMLDTEGIIVSWNEGASRLYGHDDTIVGRHYDLLCTLEDTRAGEPRHHLYAALSEGAHNVEAWRVRADGSRFWAMLTFAPMHEAGQHTGFSLLTRDLSQRRHTDMLLRSLLDNVLDGIISIDSKGTVRSFNAAAQKMFGYSEHEVIGKSVNMLMPQPYAAEHDTYMQNYQRTGVRKVIGIGRHVEAMRKDGATFPIELGVSEFFVDGERYFTGVIKDITEQRKLEEQLRQSQKMEAIGLLAGGVAHDFNNLLTIICGYSEFLADELPPEDPRLLSIKAISDAADRAAGLTRQLLAFGRKAVYEPVVLDINNVVRETEKMLHRVIGEDIDLVATLAPDANRVRFDPGHLNQILLNLAVNARDAMPQGGRITIETMNVLLDDHYQRLHPDVPIGDYVLLAFSDTGSGMPPEVKARIFEPFFTTKGAGKGTGLGLATVYGIVKQGGGHIQVYSEPGQGTTFKVYLPATEVEAVNEESQHTREAARGSETILLVEDEEAVRVFSTMSLENFGYRVLHASNAEEAIAVFEQHKEDIKLLLTDVVMPEKSGRQLAEILLAMAPALKVLFVSGYTDDAIVRHGLLQSESHFLQKPFTPLTLAKKVRQVLDETTPE